MCRPSESYICDIVSRKQLLNFEVTEQDVRNPYSIFQLNLVSLKGMKTRKGEPHVELAT